MDHRRFRIQRTGVAYCVILLAYLTFILAIILILAIMFADPIIGPSNYEHEIGIIKRLF